MIGSNNVQELIPTPFLFFHFLFLFFHGLFRQLPLVILLIVFFRCQRLYVEKVVEFEPMPRLSPVQLIVLPDVIRLPFNSVP